MLAAAGEELAALINAYSPDPATPVAVAVSGGSDSTALLHLAADWARKTQRKLHVLTVNHGLRPAAADEAAQVTLSAHELGLGHDVLSWDTPKPGQAAARDARHRLLAGATRAMGARVLLLGHTRDDIIETVLMRKRRRAPRTGLAGPVMAAPSPVWPDGREVTLLRPLLRMQRADLRAELVQAGIDWVDDPSNQDTAYERIRVRQFLTRHPALATAMRQITAALILQRQTRERLLSQTLLDVAQVQVADDGLIRFTAAQSDTAAVQRTLSVLMRIAGGHDSPPRAEAVRMLIQRLARTGARATLSGAWLQRTREGYLIGRDPGAVSGLDGHGLWDGRYERAAGECLPDMTAVLLRASMPPDQKWRSLIAERIGHEARAYAGAGLPDASAQSGPEITAKGRGEILL